MIKRLNETDYSSAALRVRELLADRKPLACVITFGCQQNEADSEKIRKIAVDMGYGVTDDPYEASLIVLNTCAVRRHAELKATSILGNFKAYKQEHPDTIIALCGCMAAEPSTVASLKTHFHFLNFTLEPNMLHKFPVLVLHAMEEGKRTFLLGEDEGDVVEGIGAVRRHSHRAWVSIMYGCNNFCSYCIVPYVRGRERSRASSDVLAECRELVASGCREITLLGQNVNSYASDVDFAGLLEQIAAIDGDFIIRFMTSHPKDVSDRLIAVMAKNPIKIAPYFHLPLQSGSDRILKAMHRTYDTAKYLDTVDKLRAAVPGIALSSDIIIGFPGEEDEDFADTMKILERVRFDMVYSFLFSPREGTRAAKMENTVPRAAMNERMAYLLDVSGKISYEKNQPYVGRVLRVLTDEAKEEDGKILLTGRTPENKLIHFTSHDPRVGRFADVKVDRAGAFVLYGEEEKRN